MGESPDDHGGSGKLGDEGNRGLWLGKVKHKKEDLVDYEGSFVHKKSLRSSTIGPERLDWGRV